MREVAFRDGSTATIKLTSSSETARSLGFSQGSASASLTLTTVSEDDSTVVEYACEGVEAEKADTTRASIKAVLESLKATAVAPPAPSAAGGSDGALVAER